MQGLATSEVVLGRGSTVSSRCLGRPPGRINLPPRGGTDPMSDQSLTILLRLIHILGGIFWVGTMMLLAAFLIPTVRATGREGGKFMEHLMQQRRLRVYLGVAMLLTVL